MNLHLKVIEMPKKLREWAEKREEQQAKHVGTHIDVYYKTKLDDSLKECRGIVLDVRNIEKIGIEILKDKAIRKDDFVIFRTGYMEKFGYGSDSYFSIEKAPYLTDELVDKLIGIGVKLIGIDFHSIQLGENHIKIDKYAESKGTFIVENMNNLDKVSEILNLKLRWSQSREATAIPVFIESLI